MKKHKIGYISDLHLDFYLSKNSEKNIKKFIDTLMKPEKMDILLIAGDEGHYESQTKEFIKQMKEYANHILLVGGNHSMYLINNSQKNKHKYKSSNRIKDIQEWCLLEDNVYYMDGNVITIDDIKIGGYMNWYNLDTNGKINQWNEYMNDSNLIIENHEPIVISYGYGGVLKESRWDTQHFRKLQEQNLDKIIQEKCDILLTHIVPCIIPDEINSYKSSEHDMFYMTDDFDKVKQTGAEIVIYGHDHTVKKWSKDNIQFMTNALGYPSEPCADKIEYFYY